MASELESYRQMMDDLRCQVSTLIAGLPPEALNWRPLEGADEHATNSLAVLAAHVAGSERFWMGEAVGGLPPSRDRDAEFAVQAQDASALVRALEAVGAETSAILARLSASDLAGTREVKDRVVSVRWCILHVIDHTALHLGHMQLTYQLWQGGQSSSSPRWFERVDAGG